MQVKCKHGEWGEGGELHPAPKSILDKYLRNKRVNEKNAIKDLNENGDSGCTYFKTKLRSLAGLAEWLSVDL